MKLTGRIAQWEECRWRRSILIFHLEASTIKGLPEDVNAGEGPLRVRVNKKTQVEGAVRPGADVTVEGILSLNEIYPPGCLKPPHIDADVVTVD